MEDKEKLIADVFDDSEEETVEAEEVLEVEESNATESVAYLEREVADRFLDFLKYSGIEDVVSEYDELNGTYDVKVTTKDFEKAQNLFGVFSENELETEDEDTKVDANESSSEDSDEDTDNSTKKSSKKSSKESTVNLYENSTEKYKDNLSSAITFFICGAAGLIILLLNDFGVLKFLSREGASFILMNVVLGALFVGFIVIGWVSLKYSKKVKIQAEKEQKANDEMNDWLKENITVEAIEASYDESIPEEMKYFSRSKFIKDAIAASEDYGDLEDEIVEVITDRYIEYLFGEQ